MNPNPVDRRRSTRVRVLLEASVLGDPSRAPGRIAACSVADLSPEGCRLVGGRLVAPGQRLQLRLELSPGLAVSVLGRVVWTSAPQRACGLELVGARLPRWMLESAAQHGGRAAR